MNNHYITITKKDLRTNNLFIKPYPRTVIQRAIQRTFDLGYHLHFEHYNKGMVVSVREINGEEYHLAFIFSKSLTSKMTPDTILKEGDKFRISCFKNEGQIIIT